MSFSKSSLLQQQQLQQLQQLQPQSQQKQSKQLQSQQSQPTSQIETSQPLQQKSRRMAHIISEKKGERILIQDLKNLKVLYQVADPEAVKRC
ncbi:hypothetical protein Glove_43g77 [Diversispora epigaea]|uniref:Uncharacterized protein n=1 Tax=Diversispora epigaea TaxID=1348612 RepID=A0A397JGY6_9GLOM|nr:hypothetical protein Glove_43g77 [Diversispora epigaea]